MHYFQIHFLITNMEFRFSIDHKPLAFHLTYENPLLIQVTRGFKLCGRCLLDYAPKIRTLVLSSHIVHICDLIEDVLGYRFLGILVIKHVEDYVVK